MEKYPTDLSVESVRNFVFDIDTEFEDLQGLCMDLVHKRFPHVDCFYNGGCGCNNIRLGIKPKKK